jgi:geranylgeranyl reductase
MLRVAVVGGGPSGSCAAEVLAKAGIATWLFERKLDNAKPCGGAIPLCMVEEFDLPESIIDRKVRNMRMISPSNREVDIHLENPSEYIGKAPTRFTTLITATAKPQAISRASR